MKYYLADFAPLDDVRQLAADLSSAHERIDVLANNAEVLWRLRCRGLGSGHGAAPARKILSHSGSSAVVQVVGELP